MSPITLEFQTVLPARVGTVNNSLLGVVSVRCTYYPEGYDHGGGPEEAQVLVTSLYRVEQPEVELWGRAPYPVKDWVKVEALEVVRHRLMLEEEPLGVDER